MASVEDTAEVVCSRGVRLVADTLISELLGGTDLRYDAIALPVRSIARNIVTTAVLVHAHGEDHIMLFLRQACCATKLPTFVPLLGRDARR